MKRKYFRILIFVLVLLFALSVLSACGEQEETDNGKHPSMIRVEVNRDQMPYRLILRLCNESKATVVGGEWSLKIYNEKNVLLFEETRYELALERDEWTEYKFVLNPSDYEYEQELRYTDYEYLNVVMSVESLSFLGYEKTHEYDYETELNRADAEALKKDYEAALALYGAGDYPSALPLLRKVGNYGEGKSMRNTCHQTLYKQAETLFAEGAYAEARAIFLVLDRYNNSYQEVERCDVFLADPEAAAVYRRARTLWEEEKYGEAMALYESIIDFHDSKDQLDAVVKAAEKEATRLGNEGDYAAARDILKSLGYDRSNQLYKQYDQAADGQYAEAVASGLQQLILPEGITEIPAEWFQGSALISLRCPKSLRSIADFAFEGCKTLREVELQEGLLTIGQAAFRRCDAMRAITLPKTLTAIGADAFSGCSVLREIVIPTMVREIPASAFFGCAGLESLTLHDGVETIGDSAFSGCTSLVELRLPAYLQSIGANAFFACTKLRTLEIPAFVSLIGKNAFSSCNVLGKVTFAEPNGWKLVGKEGTLDLSAPKSNASKLHSSEYGDYAWVREVIVA